MRRAVLLFFVLLSCVLAVGVGASCTQPTTPSLEVTPSSSVLVTGQVVRLVVTRHYPGGPVEVVTDRVRYSSSNRNIVAVNDEGEVTAGDEPGSAILRVSDPQSDALVAVSVTVVAPTIASIEIAPIPAIVIQPGAKLGLTATARLTDGTTKDVTSQVVWASSAEAVATVGKTAADFGVVTGLTIGDATITATDAASNVQGRALVFVRGGEVKLEAIVVTPNPAVFTVGQAVQLAARGVFSDGTTRDLTSVAEWTSANAGTVAVDSTGRATGVAVGETTITASSEPSAAAGDRGAGDGGDGDGGAGDGGDGGAPPAVVRGSALARIE